MCAIENVILILPLPLYLCSARRMALCNASSTHDEVDPTKCEVAVAHVWNTHRTLATTDIADFHDSKQVDPYMSSCVRARSASLVFVFEWFFQNE